VSLFHPLLSAPPSLLPPAPHDLLASSLGLPGLLQKGQPDLCPAAPSAGRSPETAWPRGPNFNEFKTCWAGPRRAGLGLCRRKPKTGLLSGDLRPGAWQALLRQAGNYLESCVGLKQRTHKTLFNSAAASLAQLPSCPTQAPHGLLPAPGRLRPGASSWMQEGPRSPSPATRWAPIPPAS
jgi:hypothetical protein